MTANLLSRLQGLTAPDREVDADIFQLLGGSEWDKAYIRAQEPCGCPHDLAVSTARERYSPAYTASLDAAVALCVCMAFIARLVAQDRVSGGRDGE